MNQKDLLTIMQSHIESSKIMIDLLRELEKHVDRLEKDNQRLEEMYTKSQQKVKELEHQVTKLSYNQKQLKE